MKCIDCREREVEFILIDYDEIKPLCSDCLQGYIQIEGEMNLNFCHIGFPDTIYKEINHVLSYLDRRYIYLLDEYNKQKSVRDKVISKIYEYLKSKEKRNDPLIPKVIVDIKQILEEG